MTTDHSQEALAKEVFEQGRAVLSVAASMISLVAYDICIFFPDELRFVWKSRWSFGKLLYLIIRYGSFLLLTFGFFGSMFIDSSNPFCPRLNQSYAAFGCGISCFIEVTQTLRAIALFGSSRRGKLAISICCSVQLIAMFALSINMVLSYQSIQYPFEGYPCALTAAFPNSIYISFYTTLVIPDLLFCIICSIKVFRIWTEGDSTLAWTMFRDMLAYMIILAILAFPQFLTPLLLPAKSNIIIANLNITIIAVAGIISCRFVLNMRSYVIGDPDVSLTTMSMACPTTATISQMRFDHDEEGVDQNDSIGGYYETVPLEGESNSYAA